MNIGENMRKLRGKRTQAEIAKKVNISKSAYAMYERNERMPRDEVKVRIADFFGKTVQELFFNQ